MKPPNRFSHARQYEKDGRLVSTFTWMNAPLIPIGSKKITAADGPAPEPPEHHRVSGPDRPGGEFPMPGRSCVPARTSPIKQPALLTISSTQSRSEQTAPPPRTASIYSGVVHHRTAPLSPPAPPASHFLFRCPPSCDRASRPLGPDAVAPMVSTLLLHRT
ncbi:hypothetical protein LZ30DRAFT_11647 [Colletotrichum cereale]|nr:hypothetical protein LZ30DRAFT_11647 [Colletotrichum cereale]